MILGDATDGIAYKALYEQKYLEHEKVKAELAEVSAVLAKTHIS